MKAAKHAARSSNFFIMLINFVSKIVYCKPQNKISWLETKIVSNGLTKILLFYELPKFFMKKLQKNTIIILLGSVL